MRTFVLAGALAGVAVLLASGANAATLNVRPVSVLNSSETPLQTLLNNVGAGETVNGPGSTQSPVALWAAPVAGGATTLVFEIAGNKNLNTFGIYADGNTANRVQLFTGPTSPVTTVTLTIDALGNVTTSNGNNGTGFTGQFGFYLAGSNGNVFFTEDDENGGKAQAVVFQGSNPATNLSGSLAGYTYGPKDWIIAFEDLKFANSDKDYNDMVVLAQGIAPVPVPAALPLMLSALGGLGLIARRRKAATA